MDTIPEVHISEPRGAVLGGAKGSEVPLALISSTKLLSRERLVARFREAVQAIITKQLSRILMSPQLVLDPTINDQELVDTLADSISQLLKLCLKDKVQLGETLQNIAKNQAASTKYSDNLHESLSKQKNFDENGIYWLRQLVKSKSSHLVLEGLLTEVSEHWPTEWDSTEDLLLLNHNCDFISLLGSLKQISFDFSLDAPIPPPHEVITSSPSSNDTPISMDTKKKNKKRVVEL